MLPSAYPGRATDAREGSSARQPASPPQTRTSTIHRSQAPTPTRILHLTDPHLFASTDGELRGRTTYACLLRVLDHYRRSAWTADLALITGDLVQDDSGEAYEHFCRMTAALQLPLLCVPGNHDVRPLMTEVLGKWSVPVCTTVDAKPWLVVGVDSCVDGAAGGRVASAEMARLSSIINETDAQHLLVAMHHPPVAVGTRWLDSVGLENGEEFLRLLATSGKVKIVLFGHIHQHFEARQAAIRILGTPSTCRQFRPGSDTFAVDHQPPAYRRLTLLPDGEVTTEVIPVP